MHVRLDVVDELPGLLVAEVEVLSADQVDGDAAQVRPLDDPAQMPACVRRGDATFEKLLLNRPRGVWIHDDQVGVEAHVDDTLSSEARKPRSRVRSQFLRNESRHNNQTQGQNSGY